MKVLVIDDEQDFCRVSCALLRHEGFEARCAFDGWAGLAAPVDWNPDYIVLDRMMPGMDGLETARQLRTLGFPGRIAMLTADVEISETIAMQAGCDRLYLKSNFDYDCMCDLIRSDLAVG